MLDSLPPHSVELEEAVIGSILQSQDALLRIVGTLPTEAFFVPLHREIYQAASDIYQDQLQPDLYAIASRFKDESDKVQEIARICNKVLVPENVESYAAIVIDRYNRRRLIELGQKAIALAYDLTTDWDSVIEEMEGKLTSVTFGKSEDDEATPLYEILGELFNEFNTPDKDTLPTNIPQVDEFLSGGIRPKTLTVIAGATGMGKSQVLNKFAYEIAGYAVRTNDDTKPVVIYSMEMSKKQMAARILSVDCQIPLTRIISKQVKAEDYPVIVDSLGRLADYPLYINDTPGDTLTLGKIASDCYRLKRKHGGLGLILVDYLQMFGDRSSVQRSGEVGKYSQGLLALSKRLDCPIVALAQINQAPAARTNKRPTLNDVGESAKIGQDANTVILLYREDYYSSEKNYEEEVPLELIVAKNRNGPCGTATVYFHLPTGRIRGDRPSYSF